METTVRDLLKRKRGTLHVVAESDSVFQAVRALVEYNISALLVVDGPTLVGILTERDVVRNVLLENKPRTSAVREIMTREVVCVRLEQSTEECMEIMTQKRIRHLPVMDEGKLVGILSIRDLVGTLVSQKQFVIEQLENYITGRV